MPQAQNQPLWHRAPCGVGDFGRAGHNRVVVGLSAAAEQNPAEENPGQARHTNASTHSGLPESSQWHLELFECSNGAGM